MSNLALNPGSAVHVEDDRTSFSKESPKRAFFDNLFHIQGKFPALATINDYYTALAHVVRDRLLQRWVSTAAEYTAKGSRTGIPLGRISHGAAPWEQFNQLWHS